jgi:hypothetical protein
MMGFYGAGGYGFMSVFGLLWAVVWSINSVLIMLVLWKLYERLGKK